MVDLAATNGRDANSGLALSLSAWLVMPMLLGRIRTFLSRYSKTRVILWRAHRRTNRGRRACRHGDVQTSASASWPGGRGGRSSPESSGDLLLVLRISEMDLEVINGHVRAESVLLRCAIQTLDSGDKKVLRIRIMTSWRHYLI